MSVDTRGTSGHLHTTYTYHDIEFTCVEQFMMLAKAKLFNDEVSAERILATRDPMTQKMIGRKVAGFDLQTWEARVDCIRWMLLLRQMEMVKRYGWRNVTQQNQRNQTRIQLGLDCCMNDSVIVVIEN